ncbi:MAG: hypothetical protein K2N92_01195, partial [Malacoplasma sp.]|nr:hypothetical protein [Malacoplasma sp.]MDE7112194.1 hypothetical protein [Malacoplasma sp.]
MSTKKKILITAGIGTAAVVAGVSPAIVSATNTQSSSINVNPNNPSNPVDPNNPTNPDNPNVDDPVDVANLATIPTNDEFVYSIDHFNSLPDFLLDQYLQKLFAETNFFEEYKDSFKNSSEYSNVVVTYKKDSVNEVNKTFELLVTPVSGKTWSNKTNDAKTVVVNIKNIEDLDAEAPSSDVVVSYNRKIDGTFFKNNADLNKYLYELFLEDQSEYFSVPEGNLNFKNVNISYFLQTADLSNKTFKVSVSPQDKHNWNESLKYSNSVTFTVKMTNFVKQNDAEAPKENTVALFNKLVDGTKIKTNNDLNTYLKNLFSTDQSANLADAEGNSVFKNVKIIYYDNSANLENKTFKILVYPKDGHTWIDSLANLPGSFFLQVKINNFTVAGIRDSLTPRTAASFTKPVLSTNFSSNADLNNYLANA